MSLDLRYHDSSFTHFHVTRTAPKDKYAPACLAAIVFADKDLSHPAHLIPSDYVFAIPNAHASTCTTNKITHNNARYNDDYALLGIL